MRNLLLIISILLNLITGQNYGNVDHSILYGPIESYGYTPSPETFKIKINNSYITSNSYFDWKGEKVSNGDTFETISPNGDIISKEILEFNYQSDVLIVDVDYMNNELHGLGVSVPVYLSRKLNDNIDGMIGFGDYSLKYFILFKPYETFHMKTLFSYNRSESGYNISNYNHFKSLSKNSLGIEQSFDLLFSPKLIVSTKLNYVLNSRDSIPQGVLVSPKNFFDLKIKPVYRIMNNLSFSTELSIDRYTLNTPIDSDKSLSGGSISISPIIGYRLLGDKKLGYFDLDGLDLNISFYRQIDGESMIIPSNFSTSLNLLFK